jgi:hypothetical protein
MGLIKELFDEAIPLPESKVSQMFIKTNMNSFYFKLPYAICNLFFQIIDCILIPAIAFLLYESWMLHGGVLKFMLMLIVLFSSAFSFYQFAYWFIKPHDDYATFKDRLIAETAVGAFISALFKVKIYYYWKR